MADTPDITQLSDNDLKALHLQTMSDDDLKALYQPPSSLLTQQKTMAGGVIRGLRDIPDAGAQMLTRGIDALLPAGSAADQYMKGEINRVDDINKNAEQDYQKNWNGNTPEAGVGRVIGSFVGNYPIAAAVPGMSAEGLLSRTAASAVGGAIGGVTNPSTDPSSFWANKATQALFGAGAGAAGAPIVGAVARAVSPKVNPDVKLLMQNSVTPTPGQIAGGWFNDLEEKFGSVPGLGDAIKSARLRAVQDLNTAAINRSLSHIGESLNPGTALGRDAIDQMHTKIGNAYDAILPNLTWRSDPQFVKGVTNIAANANLLPDQQKTFAALLKNQFSKAPGGVMSGQSYKDVESKIGQTTSDYLHSTDPDDRAIGRAFQGVQGELRGALSRSNPQFASQLSAINSAYADSLRVQGAAARQGADQGLFSPAQLSSSVRELDPTLRKGAFARGDARMQDLSDAGKSVLGNKVPDSGTPGRMLATIPALALGGEHLPLSMSVPLAAGVAGTMGAYSRPGQATLAALLASRPAVAPQIASGVRTLTPATSLLAGILAQPANR